MKLFIMPDVMPIEFLAKTEGMAGVPMAKAIKMRYTGRMKDAFS